MATSLAVTHARRFCCEYAPSVALRGRHHVNEMAGGPTACDGDIILY